MATIQDVAKYANVGVGTVSRVLSGNGYVKEETRQKVQASIEALNYTPNEMARNLFFRKSGIVAVIVPQIAHPFFAQFVSCTETALCERGYQTLVCNTYYEKNYEQRYLEMLKRQRVDGIIFGAHTSLDASQYANAHRPIVALDRSLGDTVPCVSADHKMGGRLAAEALLRSGCRNVAQFGKIRDGDKVATPSDVRHQVFAQIMKEHGVPCLNLESEWFFTDAGSYRKVADALLEDHPEVDGVFATDMTIMAILQSAHAHGRRVPEDLKLVGYDGTYGTEITYPILTAVVQPIAQLAEKAVELIIDLIDGRPIENKRVELPVALRVGGTTTKA